MIVLLIAAIVAAGLLLGTASARIWFWLHRDDEYRREWKL
jgi:hypothetical protein